MGLRGKADPPQDSKHREWEFHKNKLGAYLVTNGMEFPFDVKSRVFYFDTSSRNKASHVEESEISKQFYVREFMEEAGYEIRVVETRDIGYCDIYAVIFGRRIYNDCEMESHFFALSLNSCLSIARSTEHDPMGPGSRS